MKYAVIAKYVWMIATVGWLIFMTYLSHQNGIETAETSLKLAEFLGNTGLSADLGELNGWLRRVAHVVVFLVFSILLSITLAAWEVDWRFVLLVLIWAVIDEATKPLVDGRHVVFIPYQDKADLIYSLNAGDVHFCVNAKGIKGVSCPSKFYGLAAAGKPVLGVLEHGSEVQCLIEEIGCGHVVKPGDYAGIESEIRWFIENSSSDELRVMGAKGREYLEKELTEDVSVGKYKEDILGI